MAPEQARGKNRIDHRTDLWARSHSGEGLMGRRPFVASNYNALLVQIWLGRRRRGQDGDPLWQAVEELLNRAMARD